MNKKKIAIIGYGSIGKRHAKNLKKYFSQYEIFLITSQKKINFYKSVHNIKSLIEINPNFIIVSNETNKHIKTFKFIEKNFKNLNVLIEKPIFEKKYFFKKNHNNYYIGYNLRFHPEIKFLSGLVKLKHI